MKFFKQIFFCLLIFFTIVNSKDYKLKLTTSKSLIKTGGSFEATIDYANLSDSSTFNFSMLFSKEAGVFERLELPSHDKIKKIAKANYTSFTDPGDYYLGPLKVSFDHNTYITDSVKITIESFIASQNVTVVDSIGNKKQIPLDSLKMVLPIKEIKKYTLTASEKKVLIIGLIALIILILVLIFIIKKIKNGNKEDRKIIIKKEPEIPSHELAFTKLNDLIAKKYLEKGMFKEYAVDLSYIFREYLENRFKFEAKEIPTIDIKKSISKYKVSSEQTKKLESILDITDLIKYAKFMPLEMEMKTRYEEVIAFINASIIQKEKLEINKKNKLVQKK